MIDTQRTEILNKSDKIISQISDLVAFFEDPTLLKIFLQTKVIHKLFEENADIDINKLDLFHLQFTTTLIELLNKIKLKNERIVGMYKNEIELNNEVINKLRSKISEDNGFDAEKQKQSQRMSKSLLDLYTSIYYKSEGYPFKTDINSFGIKFYKDYFFEADADITNKILEYNKEKVYRSSYAIIEKQLLLDLRQANFKLEFFAGVKAYPILLEIYKISVSEEYFLFWSAKNLFLKFDINLFPYQKWEAEMSKKELGIKNLIKKNSKLETNIKNTHKYISNEISELLEEDYQAITNIDFLASLEDIDTQANILRSMLQTKII